MGPSLLAWYPNDVAAMLQLGLAEKARGNLDLASDWLARACELDGDSAVARFYYGEVLYNRGLNEPALAALRDAIARNPDYAEAHYLLAFVCGDLGQHEAAREATKRAIALNPTLARAQANLALERFDGASGATVASGAAGGCHGVRRAGTAMRRVPLRYCPVSESALASTSA